MSYHAPQPPPSSPQRHLLNAFGPHWMPPYPTGPIYPPYPPFYQPNLIPGPPPPQNLPGTIATSSPLKNVQIHEFWASRIAPMPGSISGTRLKPHPWNPHYLPANVYGTSSDISDSPRSSQMVVKGKKNKQTEEPFNLNKFAEIYVPQSLRDIQCTTHTLDPLPAAQEYPPASYTETFLPVSLMRELANPHAADLLVSPPPSVSTTVPPLEPHSYYPHWSHLLVHELDRLADDKASVVLWETGIKVYDWFATEFVISVPGIRENYPRLEVGDLVHMREVLLPHRTPSARAFEGRIIALRKREGLVNIYCPALKRYIHQRGFQSAYISDLEDGMPVFSPSDDIPLFFNCTWLMNSRPFCDMDAAARVFGNHLAIMGPHLARRWLFPEKSDMRKPIPLREAGEDTKWIDHGLNEEQRLAVSSIVYHHSPVPFLISGPPGTGKTRTAVETVLQILRIQPESCILLCAPSNPATDVLVQRLRHNLTPKSLLRLNGENRSFAELPIELMQYCHVENNKFALPDWASLMKYQVVACSCIDANALVTGLCTNSALIKLEETVTNSLHPHRSSKHRPKPHWTHLIIDEAAQGSEPELLVPMSVVLTPHDDEMDQGVVDQLSFSPQLVLCGDPNQLGAIIISDVARQGDLDVSLLERLFQRRLYAEHEHARSNIAALSSFQRTNFAPFVNLVKNYRSHPAILMPPSAIFYDDSLEPFADNGTISWSKLPNPALPLLFIGHNGLEDCTDERVSFFNSREIKLVRDTCKSLIAERELSSPPLRPEQIGVMAPWRQQVWKIREDLRKKGLGGVDVGTVEDYQGQENRVIILSCVRTQEQFLKDDQKRGIGLVSERKRMNVALSRAKELLVVIGNGNFLKRDPYWRSFLQFTLRNNLYTGPDLDMPVDGNYISRLESLYANPSANGDLLDENQQDMRLVRFAGGIAREVLKE
ncbi:hypothetical protein M378DRAFT_122302 [Amanita muscaria Koide BX008]|uniref:Uncharacterized protein n=1 Tax=Amanita muscaria (strain Koide BX008) TaxID=946122 RepID=A0A0C2XEZ5_AMAMK|nr:hypothetical protein M378DRAFT_122302 [Amanita muscaria Koide BX008]